MKRDMRRSARPTSEEVIAEYSTATAKDENPDVPLSALAEVAKARGLHGHVLCVCPSRN
ncbi:hypothetical protein [Methylocystis sp.]|uniref:hypothetical protein n=1 Tax=Methylocystis sp. TaxID=1911079 RepID=UPI0025DA25F9|nr:hypothetical protein [Methylocystis sp.]